MYDESGGVGTEDQVSKYPQLCAGFRELRKVATEVGRVMERAYAGRSVEQVAGADAKSKDAKDNDKAGAASAKGKNAAVAAAADMDAGKGECASWAHNFVDAQHYVDKFKPQMLDVTMAWLEGKSFVEVMESCDMMEGAIIRCIRRLEELVRELAVAAKLIGNEALEQQLLEGRARLKRGICFSASLYL